MTDSYDYDSFGNLIAVGGSTPNNSLFVGRLGDYYWDADLGRYYIRCRWYAPSLGLFLSRDPDRADSNLYRYAYNSPLTFVDPIGKAGPRRGMFLIFPRFQYRSAHNQQLSLLDFSLRGFQCLLHGEAA